MTPGTPRRRRDEWPWPVASLRPASDDAALHDAEAMVDAAALSVAQLTEELQRALGRLEAAQAGTRVAAERVAARDAACAIARARRPVS